MISEVIGWIGIVLILLAYFIVTTFKKSYRNQIIYHLVNFFGSLAIIINSVVHNSIPLVVLNGAWMLIAIYGLIKLKKP
jgi:hypothetical protein